MNWFDKWLQNKMRKAWNKPREEEQVTYAINQIGAAGLVKESGRSMDSQPNLRFGMYKAENGFIMEVYASDRRTGDSHHNLHIIPDDQDLGDAIAQIITIESLKIR